MPSRLPPPPCDRFGCVVGGVGGGGGHPLAFGIAPGPGWGGSRAGRRRPSPSSSSATGDRRNPAAGGGGTAILPCEHIHRRHHHSHRSWRMLQGTVFWTPFVPQVAPSLWVQPWGSGGKRSTPTLVPIPNPMTHPVKGSTGAPRRKIDNDVCIPNFTHPGPKGDVEANEAGLRPPPRAQAGAGG